MKHEGISTTPLLHGIVLGYLIDAREKITWHCVILVFFEELLPSSSNSRNSYVTGYTYLIETTAQKWISPELDPNLPACRRVRITKHHEN